MRARRPNPARQFCCQRVRPSARWAVVVFFSEQPHWLRLPGSCSPLVPSLDNSVAIIHSLPSASRKLPLHSKSHRREGEANKCKRATSMATCSRPPFVAASSPSPAVHRGSAPLLRLHTVRDHLLSLPSIHPSLSLAPRSLSPPRPPKKIGRSFPRVGGMRGGKQPACLLFLLLSIGCFQYSAIADQIS